jgi:uncharacterized LabA/DUF88 family protein
MKSSENNIAFIDGQNLHLGTTKYGWRVDLAKLRIYLKEKYNISEAHYFLGYLEEDNDTLYKEIQRAGFIVSFKDHHKLAKSSKKGNVDTDIVFEVMKSVIENTSFNKIVLVSGDGDYNKMVKYLVTKNKFKKILFPNKKFASSLYKDLGSEFFDYLENLKKYIV